jgi:hypothetical protein
MEKTEVNTVLALIFLATAVVVIGGLIAIPIMKQQKLQMRLANQETRGRESHRVEENARVTAVGE